MMGDSKTPARRLILCANRGRRRGPMQSETTAVAVKKGDCQ